jgi:hypothetical protein
MKRRKFSALDPFGTKSSGQQGSKQRTLATTRQNLDLHSGNNEHLFI